MADLGTVAATCAGALQRACGAWRGHTGAHGGTRGEEVVVVAAVGWGGVVVVVVGGGGRERERPFVCLSVRVAPVPKRIQKRYPPSKLLVGGWWRVAPMRSIVSVSQLDRHVSPVFSTTVYEFDRVSNEKVGNVCFFVETGKPAGSAGD
jgi:hypothetical protein